MSFSQSFSLGENTLNQLDVYAGCVGKTINRNGKSHITPTRKRSQKPSTVRLLPPSDFVISSPNSDLISSNKVADVVDESPTEKSNVLGKSIREQLKNASTSKKTHRKYMRRSRSDPITNSDSKISTSALHRKHGFTDDFAMFESTMELNETDDDRTNRKTKIKLHEKFDEDDFDKYMQNIQTPNLNNNGGGNDTKSSDDLIALSDSGGSDQHVNISEIERLMRTENFETVPASLTNDEQKDDDIEWEDSAFFNDILVSQQNNTKSTEEKENDVSLFDDQPDVVIDVECISMQSSQHVDKDAEEDAFESFFSENKDHVSNINSIEIKSMNKTAVSQLDASIFSRSISDQVISNEVLPASIIVPKTERASNLSLAPINKLSIDNLREWNCSASIVKAYKKKGILEMFEWQAECLNNPKVTLFESFPLKCELLRSLLISDQRWKR